MNRPVEGRTKTLVHAVPFLILALLLAYTYAGFLERTYGFAWNPDGYVSAVFDLQPGPSLQVGDRLVQVGSLSWGDFKRDLTGTMFEGVNPGQTTLILVERGGTTLPIWWVVPGVNGGEVVAHLFSDWFLPYVFWGIGILILLFVRPRDERWGLLIAFNLITAVWLSAATVPASYHIWYSALVLRVGVWLSIPVYLHLHWVFPRPLGRLPGPALAVLYGATGVLALAQWLQALPRDAYLVGGLLAVLGSLALLLVHAVRQREMRSQLFVVWIAAVLALLPIAAVAILRIANGVAPASGLAMLSLPALPLAYVYAAYRGQLGGLEIRVNRLIPAYLFLIVLGTICTPIIAAAERVFRSPGASFSVAAATGFLVALISILAYPRFRALVERRWLGITLQSRNLPQIYSGRARSSTSIQGLVDVLEREVLPSLLIRQFVFVRLDESGPSVPLMTGMHEEPDLSLVDLQSVRAAVSAGQPHLPAEVGNRMPWVRLMLPLRVGERLLGVWFLGRRDPDDQYPDEDVHILQSLADQTAITLSNISQSDLLRAAHLAAINRQDQERLHLALDLHDGILNGLAALLMRLDDRSLTPAVQKAYDDLVRQLREIVNGLRPPLLNYGLEPAIRELLESSAMGEGIRYELDLEGAGIRYERDVEEHIFRILQEAFSNAVRHGHATTVKVSGSLRGDRIELRVTDNGVGFQIERRRRYGDLLANRHFGLLGMRERGQVIGARVWIDSKPGQGTSVQVTWPASEQ